MINAKPRLLRSGSLCLAAGASAIAIAALACLSTDRVIGIGFERGLANTGAAVTTVPPGAGVRTTATLGEPASLWLTRSEAQPGMPVHGLARIGERVTMAIDGDHRLDLEVVAVAELSAALSATENGAGSARLVMVTCRETAAHDRPARIIRVIVDADEPLASTISGVPARAL